MTKREAGMGYQVWMQTCIYIKRVLGDRTSTTLAEAKREALDYVDAYWQGSKQGMFWCKNSIRHVTLADFDDEGVWSVDVND